MNNNSNHNNKIETEINGIVFELDKSEHTASIIRASCTAKKVLIPKSILFDSEYYSIISILSNSFAKNSLLETLEFCSDSEIMSIHKNAFKNCTIRYLSIPKSMEELQSGWCKYVKYLNWITIAPNNDIFCYFDQNIILSKHNSKSEEYDTVVFARRDLMSIILPSFIKNIAPFSFSFCTKLKTIEITKDAQIFSIGNYAFAESSVQDIILPNTIQIFGKGWCKNTFKLKRVQIIDLNDNFIDNFGKQKILAQKLISKDGHSFFVLQYVNNKIKRIIIPDFITVHLLTFTSFLLNYALQLPPINVKDKR
ncbi:hypothetical protein M9Y10_024828 [Tritrichomonas musculus]|uniref:Surface antigen BspA-like n=1 Tax=Tritrichomonas musculus TaxID=1915356 RepID=A0ABR2HBB9_9EUKA